MKEEFVSVEIAKLLEAKGFPIKEFRKGLIGFFEGITVSKITEKIVEKEMLSCIPQSVVLKWLREVKKLIITIDYDEYELSNNKKRAGYGYAIQKPSNPSEFFKIGKAVYDTYEAACEASIKDCLTNLI